MDKKQAYLYARLSQKALHMITETEKRIKENLNEDIILVAYEEQTSQEKD